MKTIKILVRRIAQSDNFRFGSVTLVTGIGVQLLGVATGVIAARLLGPLERGQLALLMLLPVILGFVGDLGVDRAATFRVAQSKEHLSDLPGTLLVIAILLGSAFATLAALLSVLLLHDEPRSVQTAGLLASLLVPLSILSRFGQAQLQGRLRFRILAIARLAEPTGYLVLLLVLVATHHFELYTAVLAKLLAQFGVIAVSWAAIVSEGNLQRPSLGTARSLFSYGLRGFLTKISPNDTLQLDQWLVGLTLGAKDLAYYVVALAVLGPARIVPTALSIVIFPLLAKSRNERDVRQVKIIGVTAGFAVAVVLVMVVGSAIPLLFGKEFAPAVGPARIIAAASAAYTLRELLVATLYGRGQPGKSSLVEMFSFAALAVGLVTLPKWMGLDGVALSLMISYLLGAGAAFAFTSGSFRLVRFRLPSPITAATPVVSVLVLILAAGIAVGIVSVGPSMTVVLLTGNFILLAVPILARIGRGAFDFFEPLTWFAASMLLFVVLRPVAVISEGKFVWRGYDTRDGLDRMLVVSLIGLSCWLIGYELNFAKRIAARLPAFPKQVHADTLALYVLSLSALTVIGLFLFLRQSGLSPSWLFSGRATYDTAFRESVGYLYSAPYLMVPTLLLALVAWRQGHRTLLCSVMPIMILILLSQFIKGNRIFLMQWFLSASAFYYLSRGRRPRLFLLLATVPFVFLIFTVLRETRETGSGVSTTVALRHTLNDPAGSWNKLLLGADAEAGQGLMFLVTMIPSHEPYVPGSLLTSVAAQPFPRALWPNKPTIPEERIMNLAFPENYQRNRAGATFTAMGSFYFDSGFIGVAIGMLSMGAAFRLAWDYALKSSTLPSIALASTLPSLTVAFTRASLPPMALFAFWTVLPILVGAWAFQRKQRTSKTMEVNYGTSYTTN